MQEVITIRSNHPRMGTRKLYHLLAPKWQEQGIKLGRDQLFHLLSSNGLLVKRRQYSLKTKAIRAHYSRFPNLAKNLELAAKNQLWVSDITYWKVNKRTYYLSFITDAYSRKIVGYAVGKTLEAYHNLLALRMAVASCGQTSLAGLIHHSDRGTQYNCEDYIKELAYHEMQVSMTRGGAPMENAVAERINGILKDEYLKDSKVSTMKEAEQLVGRVVHLYNEERPHMSCGLHTPATIHDEGALPNRMWKDREKTWNSPKVKVLQDSNNFDNFLQDLQP